MLSYPTSLLGTHPEPGGPGLCRAWGRYLGQLWDLDEPLEVQHVRGPAEEVLEAAGEGEKGHREAISPLRGLALAVPLGWYL